MLEEFNAAIRTRVPQNDAYLMAEASLCGLMLITINNKDFINYKNKEDDYIRTNIIQQVNKDFGLNFNSNINNYTISPYSMTLNTFLNRSRIRKNGYIKPHYITNPRMQNNTYYTEVSK